MTDMHFNANGSTHSLRLVYQSERLVWEALVDTDDYMYFEAPEDAEIWDLFSLAINAYIGYIREGDLERKDWRNGRFHRGTDPGQTWRTEFNPEKGCGCS